MELLHTTSPDQGVYRLGQGELPRAAGRPSPATIQGFNMPQPLVLSDAVTPGDTFQIAVFGINGPISAAPANTVWFREARVEFF
jgi:hypothetical protein